MLSKKYLFIKGMLEKVSKVDIIHQRLLVLANMYVDIDRGYRFSYMPHENGEVEFLDKLKTLFPERFVFVDVGAHVGTYTQMLLERFDEYEGHLFELTQDTFAKLKTNLGSDTSLRLHHAGLSDEDGEVEYRSYHLDPTRNGISGVGREPNFDFTLHKAPCMKGATYCEREGLGRINLLKIDAEGYDLLVLKGFDRMLAEGRVDVIQYEYNFRHGDLGIATKHFYEYLEKHGYVLGPLRQKGVNFKPFESPDNDFKIGPNFIACRPEFEDALSVF